MKWIDVLRELNRNKMTNNNEIWVFLSHSNKDYEKVRLVRNMLEEENLRPLMFFLHCLNDDDEIDTLIKREIDCRTRFILCDSNNAKDSKWVQKEVEYIKSKDRIYETIDLAMSIDEIKDKLRDFITRTRIFVSYNREEVALAKAFALRIQKYDFSVYMDMLYDYTQQYTQDYAKDTISNLDASVTNGVVVAFVNSRVLSSPKDIPGSCRYELCRAIERANAKKENKLNVITFVKDKETMHHLSLDDTLVFLHKGIVICLEDIAEEERCNKALATVLRELMPKDSLMSQIENLRIGINCQKDEEEASWLYHTFTKPNFSTVELTNVCGTFVCSRNSVTNELTLNNFTPSHSNLIREENNHIAVQNLIIPDEINHFCDDCFRWITVENNFHLPDNLKTIGGIDHGVSHGCVFANSNIEEVVIPTSVDSIGIFAFGNSRIKKLVLPKGIKSVYARQFKGCHIHTLCIPKTEWESSDNDSYIRNFFIHVSYDNLELY